MGDSAGYFELLSQGYDSLFQNILAVSHLRPELNPEISLDLAGLPSSVSGHLKYIHNSKAIIHPQRGSNHNLQIFDIRDIRSLGIEWKSDLYRFFVDRSERRPFPKMSLLQVKKAFTTKTENLPNRFEISFQMGPSWEELAKDSLTEEDLLILEDITLLTWRGLSEIVRKYSIESIQSISMVEFEYSANRDWVYRRDTKHLKVEIPWSSQQVFEKMNEVEVMIKGTGLE